MSPAPKPSEPTPLDWTPELVGRFWDNNANTHDSHDQYFTFQVGAEIATFLAFITDLRGVRILDYGSGPGYLVEHLLRRGAVVSAVDYSAESVRRVNERLAGRPGWEGARQIDDGAIAAADGQFDLITCIETIEHMFDGARQKLLSEFQRVLKPGGRVMFTTPNDEDLRRSFIFCPQCNHAFHNMQHICSWNEETLSKLLRDAGFSVDFCKGVDLRRWGARRRKGPLDSSLRDLLGSTKNTILDSYCRLADQLSPRPFPNNRLFRRRLPAFPPMHLVAVATKI